MTPYLDQICWNCDSPQWMCDVKHFSKDVFIGVSKGLLIGGILGCMLAGCENLLR